MHTPKKLFNLLKNVSRIDHMHASHSLPRRSNKNVYNAIHTPKHTHMLFVSGLFRGCSFYNPIKGCN